ncbi:hypothetical protein BOW53_12810 [Solemya pervernicosa gill symbiont]|uniref:Uncharacterized protein n=2 Tax=Gammaproteobacteria incertae sedis TaxID=118884 RepID=A0A1T2L247_9GAMM|nr:hypothetical protein [Candidatus Reidiella endopervernicosa]OOZ39175.1 hypothetical protein BOW53_12810 [Solemya pervernicosa gill symbiont]QKQ27995.1 hypothetical protein HUE57_18175 [Candidatus Reidiella endopervernicosa]
MKYHNQFNRLLAAAILFLTLLMTGCVVDKPANGDLSARIIIKFTPEVAAPADNAYMAQLGEGTEATLKYIRATSGGAHLLYAGSLTDMAHLNRLIERLNNREDTIYAELDARRKTAK